MPSAAIQYVTLEATTALVAETMMPTCP